MSHVPRATDPPDHQTPAVGRHGAIQCRQSGVDDPSLRISNSLGPALSQVLTQGLRDTSYASMELLGLTGVAVPTVVLHGSGIDQHNTGWIGDASPPSTTESSDALAAICTETLPNWYGVETGTLVLDPVGLVAAPTSRLVVREGSPSATTLESLLRTILTRNHNRNVPTLCQLLVQYRGNDRYQVTVRVAELGGASRPFGRYGLASSVASPASCPIDRETPSTMTSSRRLATDDWEAEIESDYIATLGLSASDGRTSASDAANVALQLHTSRHEYAALLAGASGVEPYESLASAPTMTLSQTELAALADVTPHYESCAWPGRNSRFAPRFIPESVHTDAAGTTRESLLAGPEPTMTQLGVQNATSILEFVDGWLSVNGSSHEAVTDRSTGDPHFRGHPHDATGPVIVADPEGDGSEEFITNAGALIIAANRAHRADAHLLVITPTAKAADWARDVLTVPYVRRRGDAVELYTLPKSIHTTRGDVLVTPRCSEPVVWTVSETGDRALYQGDRCLGSGPVTEPLGSYTFELPRARRQNGSLSVSTHDGDLQAQFGTDAALYDEYRVVRRPILPVQPLFCADVTVAHRVGSSLHEPPVPFQQFEETSGGRYRRHRNRALSEFLELYTHRAPGRTTAGTSTAPRFIDQLASWYDGHSTRAPIWPFVRSQMDRRRGECEITDDGALTGYAWWTPARTLSLALAHGRAGEPETHQSNDKEQQHEPQ